MSKENEIQTLGLDYKSLGKSLVQKAQEQEREATEKIVVDSVQSIIKDITAQESLITSAKDRIEKQKQRIEALGNGKFTVSMDKNLGGPRIRFTDPELDRYL